MGDSYLGEIRMVAYNYAPQDWALCNGQELAISQYAALFALLGDTYGGNATKQTFNLPNLQGRVPLHAGNGAGLPSYALGQTGGAASVTLTTANLPAHSHTFAPEVSSLTANLSDPTGAIPAQPNSGAMGAGPTPSYIKHAPSGTGASQSTGQAGSGSPVNIEPPYLTLNFIICVNGLFPTHV